MASIFNYISYGPQNPVLSAVSEAGRRTGIQDVSKKGLQIASNAGKPMRTALGYGERFNITQAQAGEAGYFVGSLVTPGTMITKAGMQIANVGKTGYAIPGLLTIPGKIVATKKASSIAEIGNVGRITGTAGDFSKAPAAVETESFWGKLFGTETKIAGETKAGAKVAELPWTTYAAKGLKYGTIAGGGIAVLGLGGKILSGTGGAIDRFFNPPGGGTPSPGGTPVTTPAGNVIWPPWSGAGGPGGDFWGNLGAGAGAPGVGIEQNIVPLAVITGAILLGSQYMGKKKKGKRRK